MMYSTFLEMLRYIKWTDEDANALARLLPYVEPRTAEISEEFYDRIREHPDADAVFRDEAQVRRLQRSLQRWVLEVLRGPYDEAYFEQRCRIGMVHARIGLPQRYVFTAMSVIRLHLHRISAVSFADAPETELHVRTALGKVLDVELAIMLETYRDSMMERLERVERLERAGIEQRLAAAEQRYRDAIESSTALVMVLDERERPLVWNHTAARVSGYERDELLDRSPLEVLLRDEQIRERIRQIPPSSTDNFEAMLTTRSGRERFIRWSVSATMDPSTGTSVRNVLGIDLTEVREAEQRARNAERLAAVGTMAAGLAHEIRNPLNAASLHVTLLERSLKGFSNNGVATDAAAVLKAELKRLSSLVVEFLDFARPKPLQPTTLDACELTASVIELLRPDAEVVKVSLRFERPAREVWILADGERMRQVLINLVRNAVEAASTCSDAVVILRTRRVGAFAEIDVEDNGPGVPKSTPIFDAFFTTKEQGTGLGLSIVHRIIDDHGGTIDVRSRAGETVFTLRLPGALPPESHRD